MIGFRCSFKKKKKIKNPCFFKSPRSFAPRDNTIHTWLVQLQTRFASTGRCRLIWIAASIQHSNYSLHSLMDYAFSHVRNSLGANAHHHWQHVRQHSEDTIFLWISCKTAIIPPRISLHVLIGHGSLFTVLHLNNIAILWSMTQNNSHFGAICYRTWLTQELNDVPQHVCTHKASWSWWADKRRFLSPMKCTFLCW